MSSLFLRRLVLTVVPFALMGSVVLMAIFGDHGLVRRHELLRKRVEVEQRIEQLERDNAELQRKLRVMDTHRVGLERLAAEELLQAAPGSIIYRFEDEEDG